LLVVAGSLLASRSGSAHIAVASGVAFANTTQEVVFSVGHGCSGADTYNVRIEVPASVTSVRPMTSDFGKATLEKDGAGLVTAVSWQKPLANALDADEDFYKLTLRIKVPNAPFTTLYFKAHQTCRAADGTLSVVDWVAPPGAVTPDGGAAPEPAAALKIVPPRQAGWNLYTPTVEIPDLGVYFSDALIVWKDAAAYSANANTVNQIKATSGVTALTAAHPADQLYVKY
jgi:uncharacterized protein YcnI